MVVGLLCRRNYLSQPWDKLHTADPVCRIQSRIGQTEHDCKKSTSLNSLNIRFKILLVSYRPIFNKFESSDISLVNNNLFFFNFVVVCKQCTDL